MNLSNLSSNKLSWLFLYLFTLQRTLLHLPVLVHEPVKLIIQQAQLVVPPYAAAGHTVVCKLGSSLLPTPTLKARNIIILLILTSATTTVTIHITAILPNIIIATTFNHLHGIDHKFIIKSIFRIFEIKIFIESSDNIRVKI